MSRKVYIVNAQRTAVGKLGGSLKNIQPDELLLPLYKNLLNKNTFTLNEIDEVIIGQAKQNQDQSNIARYSLLKAGLPVSTPGYTVHRQCGSGMQAIHNAYLSISTGMSETVIAGGVESMSTAPYYLRNARYGYNAGNGLLLDPNTESQPGSQPVNEYGRLTMGITAENLADEYDITRKEQDEFSMQSQKKAHRAIQRGEFDEEIVPVSVPQRKKEQIDFRVDEHPRNTSIEQLSQLPPVFKENGTVTAGNSSGLNDGASMMFLASSDYIKKHSLTPLAEVVGLGVSGVSPERMGIGPVPAIRKSLKSASLSLEDIGLIELNEAFAAQSLAVIQELKLDKEKININGGAIALGHPIGNSGARISVTLLHAMKRRNIEYGISTLCTAGGQGIATIFKGLI